MSVSHPPNDLRERVAASLTATNAERRSPYAVGGVVLVTVLLAGVLVWSRGLRLDADSLGHLLLWGGSLVQLVLAGCLVVLNVKRTVPGSLPPLSTLVGVALSGLAACAVVAYAVSGASSVRVPPDDVVTRSLHCLSFEFGLATPLAIVVLIALRQGFFNEFWTVGLTTGVGVWLAADASWRLVCPYSDVEHFVFGHAAALVPVCAVVVAAIHLLPRLWRSPSM